MVQGPVLGEAHVRSICNHCACLLSTVVCRGKKSLDQTALAGVCDCENKVCFELKLGLVCCCCRGHPLRRVAWLLHLS